MKLIKKQFKLSHNQFVKISSSNVAKELLWMKDYDLTRWRVRMRKRLCMLPFHGKRCKGMDCEGCFQYGYPIVDHIGTYQHNVSKARIWISQPYYMPSEARAALEQLALQYGLHLFIEIEGAAWWHFSTAWIVISNEAIPDHAYHWQYPYFVTAKPQ